MTNDSQSIFKSKVLKSLLLSLIFVFTLQISQAQNVLMFVSHEQTYHSEYIVMKAALEAAGYTVDVRSANAQNISVYSHYADIPAMANSLSGSNNTFFQTQFLELFGSAWDAANDPLSASVAIDGSVLDITDMDAYDAMVIVGGTGSLDYRVDGSYADQGVGGRLVSADSIQQVAERLNDLAVDALMQGKPVMAQCHGASIPAFWRVPNTSGPGIEALGYSLIKDGKAVGFPESDTAPTLLSLGVTFQGVESAGNSTTTNILSDRVTITSPHSSLNDYGAGDNKILTTRDWFPQSVAYAAAALINVIDTHPTVANRIANTSVLIIHGGAVNPAGCTFSFKQTNDVPCNYGNGEAVLPADYTHLSTVLSANNGFSDDFNIQVSEVNLSGSLPFDINDQSATLTYLNDYDVVLFYKHWSTYVTDELLNAIVTYTDNGGGVVGLHHGAYNDVNFGQNKNILIQELFGVESVQSGFSASKLTYNLYATDYGHFISSNQIDYQNYAYKTSVWDTNNLPDAANGSDTYYSIIPIFDEIYANMVVTGDIPFGRGVNEITPLFSNDVSGNHNHTSGITQLYDGNTDGTIGRVAYMQVGERKENYELASTYGQLIRNAVIWTANKSVNSWDGTAWSSGIAPTSTDNVTLVGDYDTSVQGNLATQNLTANTGVNFTVADGDFIEIDGDLIHDGASFDVQSGGALITKGLVSGTNFNFQRTTTFNSNTGRYSVVGAPIANAEFSVLGGDAIVYAYDETELYNFGGNAGADRFKTPAQLGLTNMAAGVGYFSANTGDTNGLINFVGTPNTGIINVSLTLTDHPSNEDAFEGFNLVANPYPCAIDFDAFILENTNDIEGAIYIWDDFDSSTERGTNSDYVTINGAGNVDSRQSGLSKWDDNIHSMQGFFVQAKSGGDGILSFTDAMKVNTSNSDAGYYRSIDEQVSFKLTIQNEEGNYSETLIAMRDDAMLEKDRFDALLFSSTGLKIYSQLEGSSYAIQGLPQSSELNIPIGILTEQADSFTISLSEKNNLEDYSIILTDHLLVKSIVLSDNQSYQFTLGEGQVNDRFTVQITNAITAIVDLKIKSLVVFQDEAGNLIIRALQQENVLKVALISLTGQAAILSLQKLNSQEWKTKQIHQKGLYIINILTDKTRQAHKIILK